MSYFDAYKKRLKKANISEALDDDSATYAILEFKNNPSYKEAVIWDCDLGEIPIGIRMVNVDKSVFDKKFYFLPNTAIKIGAYIKVQDEFFLVTEFENNLISPYAKVTYCNQKIVFPNGSFLPCIAEGESYGVKMSATNEILLETDTKVKVTVGRNRISESIDPDFRMIFGNSKQGIYKAGDTTHYVKGLIILTCKKDKYMEELDDLEKNIAWQPNYDYNNANANYEIVGEPRIFVGQVSNFALNPNAVCDFSIDNTNVIIENIGLYSIGLRCDIPNEIVKLKAMVNGEVVAEKNIIVVS